MSLLSSPHNHRHYNYEFSDFDEKLPNDDDDDYASTFHLGGARFQ